MVDSFEIREPFEESFDLDALWPCTLEGSCSSLKSAKTLSLPSVQIDMVIVHEACVSSGLRFRARLAEGDDERLELARA
jgi:hypothetical protein